MRTATNRSKSGRTALITGVALLCACGSPLGPSGPAFEPDQVSFRIEASAHTYLNPPDYISSGIVGHTLTIGVDDYAKGLSLALTLGNYAGPGTYGVGAGAAGNEGRLLTGGATYTTAAALVNGSVRVTTESCETSSGTDPATGIYGTLTLCTLTGTFGFTAAAQGGAVVTVTEGAFRVTAQRRTG